MCREAEISLVRRDQSDDDAHDWQLLSFQSEINWPIKNEILCWEVIKPNFSKLKTVFGFGDEMVVKGLTSGQQFP